MLGDDQDGQDDWDECGASRTLRMGALGCAPDMWLVCGWYVGRHE